MVFLRDDLNAENIRNGNELPVCHLDHAVDRVDPLDRSDDSLVSRSIPLAYWQRCSYSMLSLMISR